MGHNRPLVHRRVEFEFFVASEFCPTIANMKVFAAILLACLLAVSSAQNFGNIRHLGGGLAVHTKPGSLEIGFNPRTGQLGLVRGQASHELIYTGFIPQQNFRQQRGLGGNNVLSGLMRF